MARWSIECMPVKRGMPVRVDLLLSVKWCWRRRFIDYDSVSLHSDWLHAALRPAVYSFERTEKRMRVLNYLTKHTSNSMRSSIGNRLLSAYDIGVRPMGRSDTDTGVRGAVYSSVCMPVTLFAVDRVRILVQLFGGEKNTGIHLLVMLVILVILVILVPIVLRRSLNSLIAPETCNDAEITRATLTCCGWSGRTQQYRPETEWMTEWLNDWVSDRESKEIVTRLLPRLVTLSLDSDTWSSWLLSRLIHHTWEVWWRMQETDQNNCCLYIF